MRPRACPSPGIDPHWACRCRSIRHSGQQCACRYLFRGFRFAAVPSWPNAPEVRRCSDGRSRAPGPTVNSPPKSQFISEVAVRAEMQQEVCPPNRIRCRRGRKTLFHGEAGDARGTLSVPALPPDERLPGAVAAKDQEGTGAERSQRPRPHDVREDEGLPGSRRR